MTNEYEKLQTEEIFSVLVKRIGSSNFELVSYELGKDESIGFLGEHVTLSAKVNIFTDKETHAKDLKSYTFFVKYFPACELQAVFCRETGAFKKEVFMYNLFEEIRSVGIEYIDRVPKCYFSKINYALVLENLSENGYKLVDKMHTSDYNTVLIVLKALAKLHASSIIYEEKKSDELGITYRLLDDYEKDFEDSVYNNREGFINIKDVTALLKAMHVEDIFDKLASDGKPKGFETIFLEENYSSIYKLVKPSEKYRNVICHGDLWSSNFMLKFNNNKEAVDCKLVNFQYGRYVPPSHDVIALLYLITSRAFREKHMCEILKLYYTYLEKYLKLSNINLNKILPIQDFYRSCDEQNLFALVQVASYLKLVLIDGGKLTKFFADLNNEQTISEDRKPLILGNISENDNYEQRLKESIFDLEALCDYYY